MSDLRELTKEQLIDLYVETSADLCVALNTKKTLLENNKELEAYVEILEAENCKLIMKMREYGIL